jgi:signal transduction histidine kinase/CheY-like chemotaxis protein
MEDPAVTTSYEPGVGPEGGGEMGAQLRATDWSASELGAVERWPAALRAAVGLVLGSEAPSFVAWGDEGAVFFNDGLNRLLEGDASRALGRPAHEVLQGLWAVFAPLVARVRAGDPVHGVFTLPVAGKGGIRDVPFAVALAAVRDQDGASGVLATCIDVSSVARDEQALRRLEDEREQAEAASRAKDEFIGVVSHELRAPLGSILIWSQLLRGEAPDQATLARALQMIERSTRTLARLIDDLLDASRVVAGKLQVEKAPMELRTAVEAAVEAERLSAEGKGIALELVVEAPSVRIMGDERRIQQVVHNLLSNALKFTPEGGRVEVRLQRSDAHAHLEVSDTGAGIRPDLLRVIFERFGQANPERPQAGLGLGLSITRHIVELHGGSIAAASPGPGEGATFAVTLPVLKTAEEAARVDDAAGGRRRTLEGLSILLVDDEQDAREAVAVLLRQAGAGVRSVGSAAEALTAAEQDRFDAVLSDIAMPIEDGYVLIRRLREQPKTASIPALALTAYATVEDRGKALRAGYDQHLAKPVDPGQLVSVVANLARSPRRA